MTKNLFLQGITKFISGVVIVGMLLFLSAGTFAFVNGWVLMTILFLPMLIAGIIMMFKCPDLLRKRLYAKENHVEQRNVIRLSGLMFISGFIVAGLTFRLGWYGLPEWVVGIFVFVFIVGYLLYGEVLRENKYISRTIRIERGQTVIDTGLYGVIRHPMYSATLLLFLSMPLVLGSIYSFLIFLAYPFIVAKRIENEEELLEKELEGYREYKQRVKYRLIPFVW